jgi:aryl carrier-like protein
MDNQVKVRGFRIELGEIEAAISRYPGVQQAVVIAREDAPGDKRLVAYVVCDRETPGVSEVREFLADKLPGYMAPSAVVALDAIPLTPNGKVNRRALPAPEIGGGRNEKEFMAPRTVQEQTLAEIWSQVLRRDRISIQDSLFELGADSIHVFQITARANAAGLKFTPIQLLENPRISSLALTLETQTYDSEAEESPIKRVSRSAYRIKAGSNGN